MPIWSPGWHHWPPRLPPFKPFMVWVMSLDEQPASSKSRSNKPIASQARFTSLTFPELKVLRGNADAVQNAGRSLGTAGARASRGHQLEVGAVAARGEVAAHRVRLGNRARHGKGLVVKRTREIGHGARNVVVFVEDRGLEALVGARDLGPTHLETALHPVPGAHEAAGGLRWLRGRQLDGGPLDGRERRLGGRLFRGRVVGRVLGRRRGWRVG